MYVCPPGFQTRLSVSKLHGALELDVSSNARRKKSITVGLSSARCLADTVKTED
jgi:hypothetical protein